MSGKRNRATSDATGTPGDLPVTEEKCCRGDDLHLATVADGDKVQGRPDGQDPEMEALWDADQDSQAGEVEAAISAWAAGGRSRVLGKELTEEAEKLHGRFASAAMESELYQWKTSKVFQPATGSSMSGFVVDFLRATT